MAANVSLPNTLTNGQPNDATEVMANENALVTWINTNAVHLDGAKATTGVLAGPASDPVSANDYARKAYVDASIPVGSLQLYAGTTAPSANWLISQGQAVSRTTYAVLFALIGTTFGVGDGSTTFNLPDMRGRAAIGVGTGSGLTARTLGTNYGAESVQLTSTESGVAVHGHGVTDPGHNHTLTTVGAGASVGRITVATAASDQTSTYIQSATTGVTINNHAGASAAAAHNNMQPSIGLNFLIKVL